jgi:hypothetical protein
MLKLGLHKMIVEEGQTLGTIYCILYSNYKILTNISEHQIELFRRST